MSRLRIEYQGQRLLNNVETQKTNQGSRMIRNAQVQADGLSPKTLEVQVDQILKEPHVKKTFQDLFEEAIPDDFHTGKEIKS